LERSFVCFTFLNGFSAENALEVMVMRNDKIINNVRILPPNQQVAYKKNTQEGKPKTCKLTEFYTISSGLSTR
jgi:hypothetical protein